MTKVGHSSEEVAEGYGAGQEEEAVPSMSKNGLKKAAKLKRWKEGRLEKRKREKEAKKNGEKNGEKRPRREEGEMSKRERKEAERLHLKKGLLGGQKIAIDLSFEDLMCGKEKVHLASQLARVYGENKDLTKDPAHVYLLNLVEECR